MMLIEVDCTAKKMSKEGNMENEKQFMYVNPLIRSKKHVPFSYVLFQHFGIMYSGWYLFYAF